MAEYVRMPKAHYEAACNSIRAKTGKADKIKSGEMSAEIESITGGGGSSEDVRYVTFMSYDGSVEYGKKAVAVGDDCADPIARGVFSKPTRESTAQYSYSFYGWATTPNGGANANWNKAVTEDKTVYANFSSAVRYYTITYYDGNTVLKTESLAYGSTPAYVPEKNGYNFEGWEPAFATVTGDASYYSQWSSALTFAGASWADIAEISAAGTAASTFKVGDEKAVPITYADGTTGTITVVIAGFGIDDLADGSGKAGITVMCRDVPNYKTAWCTSAASYDDCTYKGSLVYAALKEGGDIYNMLPSELLAVAKNVNKKYDTSKDSGTSPSLKTLTDKLWAPSTYELGQSTSSSYAQYAAGGSNQSALGSRYPLYEVKDFVSSQYLTYALVNATPEAGGSINYGTTWTRTICRSGSWGNFMFTCQGVTSGTYYGKYKTTVTSKAGSVLTTTSNDVMFGFCI